MNTEGVFSHVAAHIFAGSSPKLELSLLPGDNNSTTEPEQTYLYAHLGKLQKKNP